MEPRRFVFYPGNKCGRYTDNDDDTKQEGGSSRRELKFGELPKWTMVIETPANS